MNNLKSARTMRRMYKRGILNVEFDNLMGWFSYIKSKHNHARKLRFQARHRN